MTKNKHAISTDKLINYILTKGWMYLLLLGGLFLLYKFIGNVSLSFVFGALPIAILFLIILLTQSIKGFYALFGIQFILVSLNRVIEIKIGVMTLVFTFFMVALLVIYNIYKKIDWSPSKNLMTGVFLVWGIFCFLQVVNPNSVQEAWNITITHYWVYPISCAILVPLAVRNIKDIQWLLIIWAVFILFAVGKAFAQKVYGFNDSELYFLYVEGGAATHVIWSGVRYFSFFSDAANFGVHMSMAIVTFAISAFYIKSKGLKILFVLVAIAAVYGMGISGTRAAIAVPLGGLGLFVVLSKSKLYGGLGVVAFLLMFIFFRFTIIGNGNEYIRKMRSAFRPSQDLSYLVRVENRKRMKELIIRKPMGYGQGLAKGGKFHPKERMPYPPDSWLVAVWVENGYFGLALYLLVHGVLFAWCSWLLMFRIMNKQLRGMLAAWLCMCAGFFVAAYVNDVMQYPNSIVVYTGFALCLAGPYIDKQIKKQEKQKQIEQQTS